MELIITYTDGTRNLATDAENAAELILEAFSNGANVDTIEDAFGKEYGATWSVAVAAL